MSGMRRSQEVSISSVNTGRGYLVRNTRCACTGGDGAGAALHVEFCSGRRHGPRVGAVSDRLIAP